MGGKIKLFVSFVIGFGGPLLLSTKTTCVLVLLIMEERKAQSPSHRYTILCKLAPHVFLLDGGGTFGCLPKNNVIDDGERTWGMMPQTQNLYLPTQGRQLKRDSSRGHKKSQKILINMTYD